MIKKKKDRNKMIEMNLLTLMTESNKPGNEFADYITSCEQSAELKEFLPEIDILKNFYHNPEHHPETYKGEHSVFAHVIEALRVYQKNNYIINLAILFHDVGKGYTFKNRQGKLTYYSHDKFGVCVIKSIGERIGLSKEIINICSYVAEQHMRFHSIDDMNITKVIELVRHPYFDYLYTVCLCDEKSRGDLFDMEKWSIKYKKIEKAKSKIDEYNQIWYNQIWNNPLFSNVSKNDKKKIVRNLIKHPEFNNEKHIKGMIKGLTHIPKFYMTIGISGSGKSTWVKEQDINVVCPDTIRKELTGNISDQSRNKQVWDIALKQVRQYLKNGEDVILDATNVISKDRNRFLNTLPKCKNIAKLFIIEPDIAFHRVNKDIVEGVERSNVPEKIIHKQYKHLMDGFNNIDKQFDLII